VTTPATVIDTSFLAASFLPTDKNHAVAARWLGENYAQRDLIMPSLVRCEFSSALSRNGVSAKRVDEALAALEQRFTIFDTTEELLKLAAETARDHKVRGCDSVFVALAIRQRAGLVTFDRDQAKKGATVVKVELLEADPPPPSATLADDNGKKT
jgi:predicted nucleic acid-binding protein